jgi:hypothetical protein
MATPAAETQGALASFRHDVRCRNCGALAPAMFCPSCGQETQVALPTARQFIKDAAGRIVSLDGRLWRTLAALIFRPGYLTREYFLGRRRRYVRPARLFLALSIAMFALFRVLVEVPAFNGDDLVKFEVREAPASAGPEAASEQATSAASAAPSSRAAPPAARIPSFTFDDDANVVVDGPPGLVTEAIRRRVERFNAMPRDGKVEQIVLGTVRYGPYAMVVLLPAFALLLKLLYLGGARRHPLRPRRYSEHLVFAAHDLSFLFIIIMLVVVVPWQPLRVALVLWAIVYGLWAMKVVYGGRWIGVLARAWLLAVSYFVLFGLVVVGLLATAVLLR